MCVVQNEDQLHLSAVRSEIDESRVGADRALGELKDVQDQVRRDRSDAQTKLQELNKKEVLLAGKELEIKQQQGVIDQLQKHLECTQDSCMLHSGRAIDTPITC